MSQGIFQNNLEINQALYELVVNDILPDTGINADHFWQSVQSILTEFIPINQSLLEVRNNLQKQIDDWHIQHRNEQHNPSEYKQFLRDINYLVEEGDDFQISTENVDAEIIAPTTPSKK